MQSSSKNLLPRTWFSFFSRFGKLLDIQEKCIPKVLQGINLVVCSPTASGKTEAVLAPLVERLLAEKWEGLSVLWISPTRALVNDLNARFRGPLETLTIPFARRTGDRPEFHSGHPASIVITTPESFDSLLCRHPKSLQSVQSVVLDDIHLLDGTNRGDQLRVLLHRLQRLKGGGLFTYALSATIEDPAQMGKRYMADFDVVESDSSKTIDFSLLSADGPYVDDLLKDFARREVRKVLVFANSRAETEQLVSRFRKPPFLHHTVAHHGSLSKREREEIEAFMNTSSVAMCIATTTLELGIDIGDIDAVVLYGPPHDVRSLLQRIGRGNRRRSDYTLTYGIYANPWERLLFETLFAEARLGRLAAETYTPHLSTSVQQTLSYLYQRRNVGTTQGSLTQILSPVFPAPYIAPILERLSDKEYAVETRTGVYGPSEQLLKIGRRGLIHSNIDQGQREYTVFDSKNGKSLGTVQFAASTFKLGGKNWEVVKSEGNAVWVKPASKGILLGGRAFKGKNIFWDYRLGRRVKERLFPRLGPQEFPFRKMHSTLCVVHFCGPLYGFLWQETLRRDKVEANDTDGTFLNAEGITDPQALIPDKGQLLQAVLDNTRYLKRVLSLGAFFYLLPGDLQLEAVAAALKLDFFYSHLETMTFKEISEEEYDAVLSILENTGESEE